MLIYKITNTINGKIYIGQTKKSIDVRFKTHIYKSTYNSGYNTKFYNALKKYNEKCWNIEIIEENISNDLIDEREVYWILYYNSFNEGYNSTVGGKNAYIVSNTVKKRIVNNHRKNQTEECKRKISESQIGKILSNEHKIKLSKTFSNMIWINNGIEEKRINNNSSILENWIVGRLKKGN